MKNKLIQLLSILTVIIPVILTISLLVIKTMEIMELNGMIAGTVLIIDLICAILFKPINSIAEKYKEEAEYDEFGQKKSKGKYSISKQERDLLDIQKMAELESILNSSTLAKITKKGSLHPEDDLKDMIGLKEVKQKVSEMVARMEFEKQNKKSIKSISGRHMVFYGDPGTGKTTVARIITGFLYKYKYIKENKCIEVDGNFLKARTPSETSTKTKMIIRKAYGGVLFIDEAYILAEGNSACGAEAIATLIKEMEDNRDKFILILAGYTRNMKNFLKINPGFESRIKEYLNFPNYTNNELVMIFIIMAREQGYTISKKAIKNFLIRIEKEKQTLSYGNARTVRNILDECIDKHAYNYINKNIEKKNRFRLMPEDIPTKINRNNLLEDL